MRRSLTHYWRIHLAVVAGAAVATTVLAGALLVGDSVRGSLRDLVLDRLGGIDSALIAERFFREVLADDLGSGDDGVRGAAPAIVLRGAVVHADHGTRSSNVGVFAVDERFAELFGGDAALDFERQPGQIAPSAIINESLRRELGAELGDSLVVHFGNVSAIPRDTLMGDKDPTEAVGRLRVTIAAILPNRGLGRFGLSPNQHESANLFVALSQVQRTMRQRDRVNALFLGHEDDTDPDVILAREVRVEDLGLQIDVATDHLSLTSDEFVLRPHVDEAIGRVAAEIDLPIMRVQSYLANGMRAGDRELPYSLVAALDPLDDFDWARLMLIDGSPATRPGPDGILVNSWTAGDLQVGVGDTIDMTYFVVGDREQLSIEQSRFTVEGVVQLSGLGADRSLTPQYPGIQEARDMSAWDPPFPVDLDRIRPVDEAYWDDNGATPKAFVAFDTGKQLWSSRYGTTTSVRLASRQPGETPDQLAARLTDRLLEELPPPSFGLRFQMLRRDGLEASAGATDFSGLFIGFSFFLIIAAAMLVGLLFGLGVEQRAREVGLRLAVGFPLKSVRRGWLVEGGLLASVGALLGLAGAVGYGWIMMAALRGIWLPAVGSSELYLHVRPASLAMGWVIAVVVILLFVAGTLRRLKRISPPTLLAGSVRPTAGVKQRPLVRVMAWGGLLLALGLIGYAWISGDTDNMGAAFGAGLALLISGLSFFALWCRGPQHSKGKPHRGGAIWGMAARNSAWNPGRSLLSVTLVASACFVIVMVASNRGGHTEELDALDSGSGGFDLVAESDIPLHQRLDSAEDRESLGFSDEESSRLDAVNLVPLRLLPGDDASCLNLYRPEKPRLLGVPGALIERGGFNFQRHLELPDGSTNPWELLQQPLSDGAIPVIGDANSVMWILHLGLGQDLVMQDEFGGEIVLRIVGLLSGSIFQSELLLSEEAFLRHFPGRGGYGYFLVDTPGGQREEVAQVLESRLAPFGFDSVTAADKLAAYEVVEQTYLSTFQLLGGLGLLLGTVGLSIILVRNLIERRGELATLRAFGFRRRSLALLVLAENSFLLLTGLAIGSLSALGAVAPRLVAHPAPWGSLSVTLGLVIVVGMLASIGAVWAALRIPLLPALKAER